MAAHSRLQIDVYLPGQSATAMSTLLTQCATDSVLLRRTLANVVAGSQSGYGGVGLVARAGSVTPPSGTTTFTCTAASVTVGDKIVLLTPGGPVALTAVAAGTENPLLGQYGGATDNTLATSIRLAFNSYVPAAKLVVASGSTNSIVLTSVGDSAASNLTITKQVTTAGVFSFAVNTVFTGGINLSTAKTSLITVGTNPTANDTLRFGGVVLTWKASATTENEVTIGGDTTISATNLAAKIAAHSILGGLLTETHSTNTVTISAAYPSLVHYMMYLVSSAGTVTIANQLQVTGQTVAMSASGVAATDGVF